MSHRSRLQWLCRRGSLELDLILRRYLDHHYEDAPFEEQQLFEKLLNFPDPDLQCFFIAQEDPDDPGLLELVRTVRSVASNFP